VGGLEPTLAEMTTLRLGGPPRELVVADDAAGIVATVREATPPVLLVAGGSNLVVSDEGFDGTVVHLRSRGVSGSGGQMTVAAGEPWDDFVASTVEAGLSGVECLSGIPGSTGATPIQNVGAYGQEVSQTIVSVRSYDRVLDVVVDLSAADCGFGYRSSRLRHTDRYVVLETTFELDVSARSEPVRYGELAQALGVDVGDRVPLAEVRQAVLELRRRKGMLLDPDDPDSTSAGSFFVNPVLDRSTFERLKARTAPEEPIAWPEADGRVKVSAAWLIERAGFHRGYREGPVGISSKHSLALINRGGATTAQLLALARSVRDGVAAAFGVVLKAEPTLVGVEL
jgi:UDP-N-acetylmuramate dehydrogenase